MITTRVNKYFLAAAFLIMGSGLAFGMPWSTDMYEQPSIQPYEMPLSYPKNSVATDGTTKLEEREKVEVLTTNPNQPTEASLKHGETLFKIFCTPCHGPQGKGDGLVIKRGFYPVDLTGAGTQARTEGYIYSYIRYGGKVMMPSYEESVTSSEAWDIVNYVRKLQGKLPNTTTEENSK